MSIYIYAIVKKTQAKKFHVVLHRNYLYFKITSNEKIQRPSRLISLICKQSLGTVLQLTH